MPDLICTFNLTFSDQWASDKTKDLSSGHNRVWAMRGASTGRVWCEQWGEKIREFSGGWKRLSLVAAQGVWVQ